MKADCTLRPGIEGSRGRGAEGEGIRARNDGRKD